MQRTVREVCIRQLQVEKVPVIQIIKQGPSMPSAPLQLDKATMWNLKGVQLLRLRWLLSSGVTDGQEPGAGLHAPQTLRHLSMMVDLRRHAIA